MDQERELVEYLSALGVADDVVADARRDDRLVTAAFQDFARPRPTLTLAELADRVDVPLATAVRILRCLGLPPSSPHERSYAEADVAVLGTCAAAVEHLGDDLALSVLRVVGSSFDRIADAAVARYYAVEQKSIDESDMTLRQQAESIRATAELMSASIAAISGRLLAMHLWETSRRYWSARERVTSYTSAFLAVGFVDLVGYTPLSQQLSAEELGELVSRFESVAYDSIAVAGGRLVKLIGDEVMFVALDAAAAVAAGLSLIEAFRDDGSAIAPRGAVAVGELLARDGDYYGPTVNVAARLAAVAPRFELLVTNPARDQVLASGAPLRVDEAGEHHLKGFDHTVAAHRVTRRVPADAELPT